MAGERREGLRREVERDSSRVDSHGPGGQGRRRRTILGLCALAAVALAVVSAAGPRGLRLYWKLRDDAQSLDARNAFLTSENQRLGREIRQLRSDPKAIERAAREDLGMIAKDEVVFTFE